MLLVYVEVYLYVDILLFGDVIEDGGSLDFFVRFIFSVRSRK